MKIFIVNRNHADVEPIAYGKGSSEGIPPEGSFIVTQAVTWKVGAVVIVAADLAQGQGGETPAIYLVCDRAVSPPETPESVERTGAGGGRHPLSVVRDVLARQAG